MIRPPPPRTARGYVYQGVAFVACMAAASWLAGEILQWMQAID